MSLKKHIQIFLQQSIQKKGNLNLPNNGDSP